MPIPHARANKSNSWMGARHQNLLKLWMGFQHVAKVGSTSLEQKIQDGKEKKTARRYEKQEYRPKVKTELIINKFYLK